MSASRREDIGCLKISGSLSCGPKEYLNVLLLFKRITTPLARESGDALFYFCCAPDRFFD